MYVGNKKKKLLRVDILIFVLFVVLGLYGCVFLWEIF